MWRNPSFNKAAGLQCYLKRPTPKDSISKVFLKTFFPGNHLQVVVSVYFLMVYKIGK